MALFKLVSAMSFYCYELMNGTQDPEIPKVFILKTAVVFSVFEENFLQFSCLPCIGLTPRLLAVLDPALYGQSAIYSGPWWPAVLSFVMWSPLLIVSGTSLSIL